MHTTPGGSTLAHNERGCTSRFFLFTNNPKNMGDGTTSVYFIKSGRNGEADKPLMLTCAYLYSNLPLHFFILIILLIRQIKRENLSKTWNKQSQSTHRYDRWWGIFLHDAGTLLVSGDYVYIQMISRIHQQAGFLVWVRM